MDKIEETIKVRIDSTVLNLKLKFDKYDWTVTRDGGWVLYSGYINDNKKIIGIDGDRAITLIRPVLDKKVRRILKKYKLIN